MPYRKFQKPSNGYRRPGYKACGRMVVGDAKKALVIASRLKRLINIEVKNFDVQQTSVAIGTGPIIVQLSNIPQGDGTSTRDGAQCKVIGIQLCYKIEMDLTATQSQFRIMLVLDKQTNQAIYVGGDLLEDITTQDSMLSPRNLDNLKRFSVLYDKVHLLAIDGQSQAYGKRFFKKEILLRYDASTPSIADLTQSSLSLFMLSSEVANSPVISTFTRLRYVDN